MIATNELKDFARKRGVDLIGIAPVSRLEYLPPEENPLSIFSYAERVVVLGFRIPRGSLRGIEEGTYWAGYNFMSYGDVNAVSMIQGLRDVALWLEDRGWESVPYPHYYPGGVPGLQGGLAGEPVAPDRPAPDVWLNFRAAAAAAGLGEIGYSKVFLTPQFGPRQRFCLIITDAPMAPDPMFEGKICDGCMLCVKTCPPGAISSSKTVKVTIDGREFEWGKLDAAKCTLCHAGAMRSASPFIAEQPELSGYKEGNDRENYRRAVATVHEIAENTPYYRALRRSFPHHCAICGARGCVRTCMDHLEKVGRIEARFRNPFRRRPAWQLD